MVARFKRPAFLALTLLFLVGQLPAFALQPPSRETAPVFRGTFIAEDGQVTKLTLPQGGAVAIQHSQTGELFLLSGRLLDDGHVELTLNRHTEPTQKAADATDRLVVAVGGAPAQSDLAGFALAIGEVTWAIPPAAGRPANVAGPPTSAETCCVTCGGWRVCCTVSGGWCCEIDSSCGSSCSAGPCDTQIE